MSGIPRARPDQQLVRSELRRVLESDQFKNSKRCQNLLTYVVEETLAKPSEQLKERLVGINVFGREPGYDTAEDPVVRNAAIEVRKRLAQYYVLNGASYGVRIDLRPGKYAPEFCFPGESAPPSEEDVAAPVAELHPAPEISLPEHRQPPLNRRWLVPTIAGAALLILAVTLALVHSHLRGAPLLSASPQSGAALSTPSPATLAAGDDIRILAGNTQSTPYVDRFGNQWFPDRYFTGGGAQSVAPNFFTPPADPELFRSMRIGSFSYSIPLKPNQRYELRLYFFEPQLRYGNRVGGDGENARTFDILANGQTIAKHFDIIEDAGFASTTVRAFRDIVASQDGKLHLQFIPIRDRPLLNAIELIPMDGRLIRPIRIHMGPSQYTDQSGKAWSADNFYIGGQLFDSGATVTNTPDPELFSVGRLGNFSYAIPVPPGHYTLTLYFAETWFHQPHMRVFDVTCNGVLLVHGLDVFQQAGFSHAFRKSFTGLEPNGQGKLVLSFSPSIDYADLKALEVTED